MNIEHWWKDIVRKNGKTRRQTGPSDTVPNMGLTLTGRKLNPFCGGKRPETKHQSRGTCKDIKKKSDKKTRYLRNGRNSTKIRGLEL